MEKHIRLVSWEGETFEVPFAEVLQSEFLAETPDVSEEIHLSALQIDSFSLNSVLRFFELCRKNSKFIVKKPLKSRKLHKVVEGEAFVSFVSEFDSDQLLNLIIAADKLGVKELVELCSAAIATDYSKMPFSQQLELLGMKLDLTPEEDEFIRKYEFKWFNE